VKSFYQFFEQLPQVERDLCIHYGLKERKRVLAKDVNTLHQAICWAFQWDDTKEGVEYWYSIYLRELQIFNANNKKK
jgi:hypothetical protein